MNKYLIKKISACELFDSRGNPTLEVEVTLADGIKARAMVPSGASVGAYETHELRDRKLSRLKGRGVTEAVTKINYDINKALVGMDCRDQLMIDTTMIELDGTVNKSRLGGNSILCCSSAIMKAAAKASDMPLYQFIGGMMSSTLPVPMMNVINGGIHADNPLDIQEFMIMPVGKETFSENITMAAEIIYKLKDLLKDRGLNVNCGDEGGFAPQLYSTEIVLDTIMTAIEKAGYKPGVDVLLAMDVAASGLYKDDLYVFKGEDANFSSEELVHFYKTLIHNYPIFSIEDPFSETDRKGFVSITKLLSKDIQIVGDDIFVTNPDLIAAGIKDKIANAVLIKPNQVGSISETLDAIQIAKQAGYETVISHRSGETEDTLICDLAMGTASTQIKIGGLNRTDRVGKYNELLRIENQLGGSARYFGSHILDKFNNRGSSKKGTTIA